MSTKKILIVEDDTDIRDSLREVLELEGFVVTTAINGKEGLTALRGSPNHDLVLLDVTMPVMDGWQFLEEQRKIPEISSVPVLILTAANEKRPVPPSTGFLKKPVDLDALLEVVRKYCDKE